MVNFTHRMTTWLTRQHAVKYVLFILIALVVIDGVLTNLLIQYDIAHEGNPLLMSLAGKWIFIPIKAVGAMICAWLLWDIYNHWRKLGAVSAYCALLVYAAIVFWNLSLLLGGTA